MGRDLGIDLFLAFKTTSAMRPKAGIATPKPEMDLIRQRLRQLRNEVKSAE